MSVGEVDLSLVLAAVGLAASAVTVAVAGAYAIRSGVVRSLRFGPFEIQGSITPAQVTALESTVKDKPFEATALASYYNQALTRATVSFWFSLIFAAIGFAVIIFAFATHEAGDIGGTALKLTSGAVIDAVSSLFFIQSTNAQKSMGEFFEKLRLDRLNAEAREMLGEIENAERRDQLRSQLVLKYSAIDRLVASDINPAS